MSNSLQKVEFTCCVSNLLLLPQHDLHYFCSTWSLALLFHSCCPLCHPSAAASARAP